MQKYEGEVLFDGHSSVLPNKTMYGKKGKVRLFPLYGFHHGAFLGPNYNCILSMEL